MEFFLGVSVGVLFIWIVILSFFLFKTRSHYNNLIKRTNKEHLDEILEKLISKDDELSQRVMNLSHSLIEVNSKQKSVLHKIGFLRFNPFEHIGGDQSFIVSLLNDENSGIIFNFLYTREGIRVYAKRVNKGVSEEYELSQEEKEVITKAK